MGIQGWYRSLGDFYRTFDLSFYVDAMDCLVVRSIFCKANLEHSQGRRTFLVATIQSFTTGTNFLGKLPADDPLGYL